MPIQLHERRRVITRLPVNVDLVEYDVDLEFTDSPRRLSRRTSVARFLREIDGQLNRYFTNIFRFERMRRNDRIVIRLDFGLADNGPNARSFFVNMRLRNNPIARLFDIISDVLNSQEALMLALWNFQMSLVRIPRGQGNKRKAPFSFTSAIAKKSTVKIRDDGNMCMWRAIVVCIHYQNRNELIAADPGNEKKYKTWYKKVARVQSSQQGVLARLLQQGTQTDQGTFDELVTISNYEHVKRNITVISLDEPKYILFRTADQCAGKPYSRTIYLWKQGDHYNSINSITGFLGCSYYCENCMVRSHDKYKHRCPDSTRCRLCKREREEHQDRLQMKIQCEPCFRWFDDQICYDLHKQDLCKRTWKYVFSYFFVLM